MENSRPGKSSARATSAWHHAVTLPLKPDSGLHACHFTTTPVSRYRCASGQAQSRPNCRMAAIEDTTTNIGRMVGCHSTLRKAERSKSFVAAAFDRDASTNVTTCCDDTNWIEYAFPTQGHRQLLPAFITVGTVPVCMGISSARMRVHAASSV